MEKHQLKAGDLGGREADQPHLGICLGSLIYTLNSAAFSHTGILKNIQTAIFSWGQHFEENMDNPISLFLSGGFASSNWLSKGPKSPDDRMLKDTSYPVRMHGSAGSTKIPTIPLLLHAFKRAPECVQIFEQTNRRFYVMNVGHPSPVYFFSAGTM